MKTVHVGCGKSWSSHTPPSFWLLMSIAMMFIRFLVLYWIKFCCNALKLVTGTYKGGANGALSEVTWSEHGTTVREWLFPCPIGVGAIALKKRDLSRSSSIFMTKLVALVSLSVWQSYGLGGFLLFGVSLILLLGSLSCWR